MIRTISILSLVDLAIFLAAVGQPLAIAFWFVPVHFALTVAALILWRRRQQSVSLAFPIGAAIGPCGILLLFFLKPWSLIDARIKRLTYSPVHFRKSRSASAMTPLSTLSRILDERVRYPGADRVESLVTTLQHGSLRSRRRALETAVRSFEPRLSPLIATALTDGDQTIRALAAAAAAQVSYNLMQQRVELEAKIAFSESLDDYYALAMLLADHGCHNVLFSRSQCVRLCQEAAEWLKYLERSLPTQDTRRKAMSATRIEIAAAIPLHTSAMPKATRIQAVETAA